MKNYENLVDEHLEFMIRLACEAQEDAEIDELIAESQLEHTTEEKEITRNAYLLFQRKLAEQEQKERKDSRRRRVQRILPRTISVAACLVILLAIATPFAVANISSIRVKVLQMLIRIEEDHAKLSLVEDEDASFDVPSGWQGDYYPTYIPDGYEVSYIGRYSATVEFSNTEGNVLTFNECSESDQYNIDSENALMSYEFINGQQVFTVESTYTTSVAWSNGRKLFVVDGAMAKDELLKIAESVQLIK